MSNPVTPGKRPLWQRRDQLSTARCHGPEILSLHRDGWTPQYIGAAFDISGSAVKAFLDDAERAAPPRPEHCILEEIAFGRIRFRVADRRGRKVGPAHDDRAKAEALAHRLNRPPPAQRPCVCCGRMMDTGGGRLWRCSECKRPTKAGTGGGPTPRPDPRRISA